MEDLRAFISGERQTKLSSDGAEKLFACLADDAIEALLEIGRRKRLQSAEEQTAKSSIKQVKRRRVVMAYTTQPRPPVETSNQFEALSSSEEEDEEEEAKTEEMTGIEQAVVDEPRVKLPPPIVVRDKSKWTFVTRKLDLRNLRFTKAKNLADGISVQAASIDDFRGITKFLEEEKIPFHTFQLQQDKPLKVVIRGIPADVDTEPLKAELKEKGLPVIAVARMSNRLKKPMPLLLVTLSREQKAKEIFNLTSLSYLRVSVESPHKKPGTVSQCHRCQRFHHAQRGCRAEPRCVKCGQQHHTITCKKTRDEPAKCANCGGAHPANYRGCPAFPKPRIARPAGVKATQPAKQSSVVSPAISYAKAASGSKASDTVESQNQNSTSTSAAVNADNANIIAQLVQLVSRIDINRLLEVAKKVLTALTSANGMPEILTALLGCAQDIATLFAP